MDLDAYEDDEKVETTSEEDKTDLENALKRFSICNEAERDNRKRGLECDKFSIGEQWPDVVKADRDIDNRPCLVINQVPKFIRTVTNELRMNRPGIKVSPTEEQYVTTADVKEGLIRAIMVKSNSDSAIDTAVDSQVRKGFGYFRVLTQYCGDDSFDQEIRVKRIKNAFTVYLDPGIDEPTGEDGKFAFVVDDMDKDEYKLKYPKSELTNINLDTIGDSAAEWMGSDYIRVAEYWFVKETPKEIYLTEDGKVTDVKPKKFLKKRTVQDRCVYMYKINGLEILEKNEWAGKYIPIIPVWGEDLIIDGKRIIKGMVEDMMDSQRQYNYWSSAATEAIALAPKAPFVMAEGQQEGYEDQWQQANVKNYPYLLYSPVTINGQMAAPPQRQTAEPPVQAMAMAIRQSADDMRQTTGLFNDNLGQQSNAVSGKAILAKQNQGDVATYHYGDNLKHAIRYLGNILDDLIPKIYDSARIEEIVHEDGTHEAIPINQEHKRGKQTVNFDLTKGKYSIVIDAGPSYSTKRQQTVDQITMLAQTDPQIMAVAGDILVKNMDWPGAQQISARLKAMLPPPVKAVVEQEDNGKSDVSPEIQQEIVQMHEIIQKGQQAIQEMQQALASKQQEQSDKSRELDIKDKDMNLKAFEAKIKVLKEVPGHSDEISALLQQVDDIAGAPTPEVAMRNRQQDLTIQQAQMAQKEQEITQSRQHNEQLMMGLQAIMLSVQQLNDSIMKPTIAKYDAEGKLIEVKKV